MTRQIDGSGADVGPPDDRPGAVVAANARVVSTTKGAHRTTPANAAAGVSDTRVR